MSKLFVDSISEIKKIIERLESRNLAEALLLNEKLRKKSEIDTTEIIRNWRDKILL